MMIGWFASGFAAFVAVSVCLDKKRTKERMIGKIRAGFGRKNEERLSEDILVSIRDIISEEELTSNEASFFLDKITWNDLELDVIYQSMNQTMTSAGQEILYRMLHELVRDKEVLSEREKKLRYLTEHITEREQLQLRLSFAGKLPKMPVFQVLSQLKTAVLIKRLPHILMAVCFLVTAFGTLLGLFSARIPAAPFVIACFFVTIINIASYFRQKALMDRYLPAFRYVFRLVYAGEKLLPLLEKDDVWKPEREKLAAAIKKIRKLSRYSFFVTSGVSMSGNPMDVLLDYVRMILHADLIRFSGILSGMQREYRQIIVLYETLGQIDALIAMTSFRSYLSGISDCCTPVFCDKPYDETHAEKELMIQNVFHPMLEHPVPNSFGTNSGILVTGSNASGKSTFLKSVALCAIFAQTLHLCPALAYRAPLCSVMTSMALRDHLASSESYYIVETRSLKRIMDEAGKGDPVLVVIDEILRGTNTVERIASSSHILKKLNEKHTMVLAATHDVELADILAKHYASYHFQEQIICDEIRFDYKLYEGKAMSRNAIRLLEQIGFDENVTKEAEQMAQHFEESNEWEVL